MMQDDGSDGNVEAKPQDEMSGGSHKPLVHTITFWANQVFTVNDGWSLVFHEYLKHLVTLHMSNWKMRSHVVASHLPIHATMWQKLKMLRTCGTEVPSPL